MMRESNLLLRLLAVRKNTRAEGSTI